MIRKASIKLILLAAVLCGVSSIYRVSFCEEHFRRFNPILYRCTQISASADLIYLGESSNISTSDRDTSRNKISDFVRECLDAEVVAFDTFAVHAGIYKEWIRHFRIMPKALLVTMNLRSFNATWINSTLETQVQKSVRMRATPVCAINRFLMSLSGLNDKSEQERKIDIRKGLKNQEISVKDMPYKNAADWDHATAEKIRQRSYVSRDDSLLTVLTCHYIKNFAFTLNMENPRIKDFDAIRDFCARRSLPLYFLILPENVEDAEKLAGPQLVDIMRANRDFLVKRYSTAHCQVIDLLEALPAENFIDRDWTTEHYFEAGRRLIAERIAKQVKTGKR